jgi:acylphosphatase
MMANTIKSLHSTIIVHGRVQGVSFRAYTRDKANQLGIKGYVKNLANGTVKIEAEGIQSKIVQLIDWVKNKGSPASHVTDVEIDWEKELQGYQNFRIAW